MSLLKFKLDVIDILLEGTHPFVGSPRVDMTCGSCRRNYNDPCHPGFWSDYIDKVAELKDDS